MTPEARDLLERMAGRDGVLMVDKHQEDASKQAFATIDTQAAEIERLKAELASHPYDNPGRAL